MAAHPTPDLQLSPADAEALADRYDATRTAVEGAGLIFLAIGPDRRIVDANAVACRLLGYSREQMRFVYAGEIDPDFDDGLRDRVWPQMLLGQVARESRVFRSRSGALFPVEVTLSLDTRDDPPVTLMLARDISDQLHAEAGRQIALERREREARLLAELAVHPGVISGDVETLCEWLLEGARELLDVTRAGLWLTQDEGALLAPLRIASLPGRNVPPMPVDAVLSSQFPIYFEHLRQGEIIAADDALSDPRTLEVYRGQRGEGSIAAMLDAPLLIGGELLGVLCFEQASRPRMWTTEEQSFARSLAQIAAQTLLTRARQHDLERLRHSEERLLLAQKAAGVGSWEWSVADDTLWWSEHLYVLFGVDPALYPASPTSFLSLVHPEDRRRVKRWLRDLSHSSGTVRLDYRVLRPDGGERVFFESAQVETDAQGRVVRVIGTALDITERRRQEHRIRELAYFDGLTGLPNRTLLGDRIQRCINESRRSGAGFALLFLDLDNFKQVNDSLGHSQGDALLIEVARRLTLVLREQDTVSRLGGDEFVLLLPGLTDAEDLAATAAELLDQLRVPVRLAEMEIPVGASLGIGCYPQDGEDLETLIRNADTAMYAAKEAGRGGLRFFQPAMNTRAVRRLSIEAGLRRALERDEFELHYQPVYNVLAGDLYGAEALLRWRDPENGLIAPGDFLPVAEHSGLILPIGEWVMHAACRQALVWHAAGFGHVPVLVNISAIQLQRGDVAALAREALDATGLPAQSLCLEITESTLMERVENVIPMLDSLREMGIRIAVDDFGTGYSSLSYLSQLPLHVLKIDRSFIQAADRDYHSAVITRTVIGLARDLGLSVVAEGVETESQLQWLRDHGCNAYQGFLRSAALPAARFSHEILGLAAD